MRKIPTPLGASLVLLLGAATTAFGQAARGDVSCQPVQTALKAVVHSTRVRMALTSYNGKPSSMESIYVGDTLYVGNASRHSRTPLTPAERVQADAEMGWTLSQCRMVGRESVHGEDASVYKAHMDSRNPKRQIENKIWISSGSGLPLRWDQDSQGQFAAKTSTIFTYGADVRAPNGN